MICPACKRDMIVVEYHRVELDYCLNCQGVWFDAGELELLLESAGVSQAASFVADFLKSSGAHTSEIKRKCPICNRKMQKVKIGSVKSVLIDACTHGDGIWFDGGEVDQLFNLLSDKSPANGGNTEVFNFIKEVFKARKSG
jgi:uncharacterized protein